MNKKVSKREVILELYKAGKSTNEIQSILTAAFQNDRITSVQV